MKTITIITALTLCVFGQGQVKKEYFDYAPVVVDASGQKMHKITVQTRAYEAGRIEIQYSRNLFYWYPIIFFTPPTQVDERRTGTSEIYFTNSNFGMRESQSRVFFRRVVDPDEVDYEGDLLDVVERTIVNRLNRSNPEEDGKMFIDYESLSTITRNPTNILHQLKGATGIVIWNSRTAKQLGGVALTPRHVLCSAHAPYATGDLLYFVDRSNNVHSGKVVATVKPYGTDYNKGDYTICLLEEDLPDVIEPIRVLPVNAYTKFDPNKFNDDNTYLSTDENKAYVVFTTQEKETLITRISAAAFDEFIDPDPNNFNLEGNGTFTVSANVPDEIAAWRKPPVPGDSGNPLMLIYRRQLVLFGTFHTQNTGPFYGNGRNLNDLHRLIEDVDAFYGVTTNHILSEVDLRAVRIR